MGKRAVSCTESDDLFVVVFEHGDFVRSLLFRAGQKVGIANRTYSDGRRMTAPPAVSRHEVGVRLLSRAGNGYTLLSSARLGSMSLCDSLSRGCFAWDLGYGVGEWVTVL